jgi:(1->4)-alpha-D-glucan 1-alpha-D-glucosylmutase
MAANGRSLLPRWIEQCSPLRIRTARAAARRRHRDAVADDRRRLAARSRACDARAARLRRAPGAAWQEKALREAKLATDWAAADEAYESAARDL